MSLPRVVSSLIFAVVYFVAFAISAFAQDFPPSDVLAESREEMVDQRTISTKTFQNEDGSTTWQLGSTPIHYLNPEISEEWLDVDTTLVENNGWENNTNNIAVHLPPVLGVGSPIALGNERQLLWHPGQLLGVLRSGENTLIANPQPSEGEMVEGSNNSVVYRDLYPGADLVVEVNNGQISMALNLETLEFDGDGQQVVSITMETHIEAEPRMKEAMEMLLGQTKAGYSAPLFFGNSEDQYVIALTGNKAEDTIARDLEEDGVNIAQRKTEMFLSNGIVPQVLEIPGESGAQSTTSAALTAKFTIVGLKGITEHQNYSPSNAVTIVKGEKNRFAGMPIAVRMNTPPPPPEPRKICVNALGFPILCLPGPLPPADFCVSHADCPSGLSCNNGVCDSETAEPKDNSFNLARENAKSLVTFSGIGDLKSKLSNTKTRVSSVSLGYKISDLDKKKWSVLSRTLSERNADMGFLMATRIDSSLLSSKQKLSNLTSVDKHVLNSISNSFSYNINCMVNAGFPCRGTGGSLISSWAPHNRIWQKDGYTFGKLDGLARSDLENAINSGGNNFHIGFMATIFDTAIAVGDLRLEFTAHGIADAELEYSSLNVAETKNGELPIYPGTTLALQLDVKKLNIANSIDVSIANEAELANKYGLLVKYTEFGNVTKTLPSPIQMGPPTSQNSKARMFLSWDHVPGGDLNNMPDKPVKVELQMAFNSSGSVKKILEIPVLLKKPEVGIEFSNTGPRTLSILPTTQFTFLDRLSIKPNSLFGASEVQLHLDKLRTPTGREIKNPDVANDNYASLSRQVLSAASQSAPAGNSQSTLVAFPDQTVRLLGGSRFIPGEYELTIKACLDSLLYNAWCPQDLKFRYVLNIATPANAKALEIDLVTIDDAREPACVSQPNCKKQVEVSVYGNNLIGAAFGGNTTTAGISLAHLINEINQPLADVTPFKMQSGSDDKIAKFKGEIGGLAACGPYEVRYVRTIPNQPFATNYSRILNLHRGKKEYVVMEAENAIFSGPFGSFQDGAFSKASYKSVAGNKGVGGKMQLQFEVSRNGDYTIYLRERNRQAYRGIVGGIFVIEMKTATGWNASTANIDWTVQNHFSQYDVKAMAFPRAGSKVKLEAGKIYRIAMERSKSNNIEFPLIDMVILSDSSFPTNKELCQ